MGKSTKGRRRRGLKPGQRHRGQFKPGANAHNGAVASRGPDILLPRKPVVATGQAAALFQEQLRDPRTGRLSRSKWAKGVRGAGFRDFIKAQMRPLYALAHGDPQEGAVIANGVVRLGEFFGAYLDDKPVGPGRTTIFQFAAQEPSEEIPPGQGQSRLTAAEGRFESLDEEDAP